MHGFDEVAVVEYDTRDVAPMPDALVELAEESDVHVMLDDGHWHREMDHKFTACDRPCERFVTWRRNKQYDATNGPYCTTCFTRREVAEANATAAVEKELAAEREAANAAHWASGDWRKPPGPKRIELNTGRAERISERMSRELLLKPDERPQVAMAPLQKPEPKDKP